MANPGRKDERDSDGFGFKAEWRTAKNPVAKQGKEPIAKQGKEMDAWEASGMKRIPPKNEKERQRSLSKLDLRGSMNGRPDLDRGSLNGASMDPAPKQSPSANGEKTTGSRIPSGMVPPWKRTKSELADMDE